MKFLKSKKDVLTLFAVLALLLFTAILPAAMVKLLPDFISFEKAQVPGEKGVFLSSKEEHMQDDCLYSNFSDVPRQDLYTICHKDGGIYVCVGDTFLYRIKADFEKFPSADKLAIEKKIEAHGYSELSEIVSYMES